MLVGNPGTNGSRATFLAAVSGCRGALVGVALFSALINILYLTGSFYMLQVYDRVIPSRSVPTLIALSVLAGRPLRRPGRPRLSSAGASCCAWRDPLMNG